MTHENPTLSSLDREIADVEQRSFKLDTKARRFTHDLRVLGDLLRRDDLVSVRIRGSHLNVACPTDDDVKVIDIEIQAVSLDQIQTLLQDRIGVREQLDGLRERRRVLEEAQTAHRGIVS